MSFAASSARRSSSTSSWSRAIVSGSRVANCRAAGCSSSSTSTSSSTSSSSVPSSSSPASSPTASSPTASSSSAASACARGGRPAASASPAAASGETASPAVDGLRGRFLTFITLMIFFFFSLGGLGAPSPPFPRARSFSRSRLISSWYSLSIASLGSSLILGLFLMFLARFAYRRELSVSSRRDSSSRSSASCGRDEEKALDGQFFNLRPEAVARSRRDVRALPVDQRRDAVPERGQREVNLGGLLEALAGRAGLALALAAGEVDEVELPGVEVVPPVGALLAALDGDGIGVHLRRGDGAVAVPGGHEAVHLADALHDERAQVLHAHPARLRVPPELARPPRVLAEQVPDLLVVDLHVRHADKELLGRRARDVREDVLKRVGDYPPQVRHAPDAFHRERLAGTGLTCLTS
ncbi:MAG: hypothetical protein BJ554DRAFT_3052 [Olpidium bornovanus]|uniref:Uncharacterized protein n=1 Tax=Olpidium bornovanus TaxID=278681 RepID=A0A8H8DG53_9FUNG|nr:MAG: hypothetical protein BJ554DRAFT_3052 [Olpidium bornovanus]